LVGKLGSSSGGEATAHRLTVTPQFDLIFAIIATVAVLALGVAFAVSMRWARVVRRRADGSVAKLEVALEDANEARREALDHAARLRFLDEAGSILASSLDYQTTVAAAARHAVPRFADWCTVDVRGEGGIRQRAASQLETPALRHMSEVRSRYNLDPNASTGLAQVIRTGETQFVPEVTDAYLAAQARSPAHLEAIRELNISSAMIVPMT